jgi:hypothetical protein
LYSSSDAVASEIYPPVPVPQATILLGSIL